jgi:antitoxin component of RelBE/YafQ-DinJ toxin-antitoxin module
MQTKLTVRINDQLIKSAKRYAHRRGISLSRLIENYLNSLAVEQDDPLVQTPILQRLSGILPEDASIEDQHKHWEQKYG